MRNLKNLNFCFENQVEGETISLMDIGKILTELGYTEFLSDLTEETYVEVLIQILPSTTNVYRASKYEGLIGYDYSFLDTFSGEYIIIHVGDLFNFVVKDEKIVLSGVFASDLIQVHTIASHPKVVLLGFNGGFVLVERMLK